MKKSKVIAILCADIHLSHEPPVWRSNEPDWYAAMKRPLDEINELMFKYQCPLLCTGDVFNKWKSEPELINWALANLPHMRSIAGQHDLPEHRYDNLYRSAYETLVRAERIRNMSGFVDDRSVLKFNVCAFPFGTPITPCIKPTGTPYSDKSIYVAIVHEYVWTGKHRYPTAPKEARIETRSGKMIKGKLYGYDVIVYGDNHKGFITHVGKTTVFNCGTLMRRKSDEEDYKPKVGLLYSNGTVEPYYLDISKDKHLTAEEVKDVEEIEQLDMELFAKELRTLSASALDFADAMKRFWRSDKTKKAVRHIITKAMEK